MSQPNALTDALAQKAARIRRCVERAREEYALATDFLSDHSRQDAAILNIQRACELAIDMANMRITSEKWGLPRSAKEGFALLQERGVLPTELAETLQHMVGFRNIAVHQYEAIDMHIVEYIITHQLNDLLRFAGTLLTQQPLTPSEPTDSTGDPCP